MKTSPPPFQSHRQGYTLSEVIMAMAVVAIVIPLVLGLVIAGGEGSRKAERETRAVMTARSVFEEARLALTNSSELVQREELPWANIRDGRSEATEPSDWLFFELDQEGRVLRQSPEMTYEEGWRGESPDIVAIAAIRGGLVEIEGTADSEGAPMQIFQLELRVEDPARASANNRERSVFIKTESLR